LGIVNILVLNTAIQHSTEDFTQIKDEDIEDTFNVNIQSMFRMTKEALKYLKEEIILYAIHQSMLLEAIKN
jgi:NAD(P)-dependent dehydrogenase (short-subunit alcohol dehydrogenase family)